MSLEDFFKRADERYAADKAAGLHDVRCEQVRNVDQHHNGFHLCHCSRRRRIALGVTTAPTDPLDFPPPSCPNEFEVPHKVRLDDATARILGRETRDDASLSHDGDGWVCHVCNLAWDRDGYGGAEFTDTHADSDDALRAERDKWLASRKEAC